MERDWRGVTDDALPVAALCTSQSSLNLVPGARVELARHRWRGILSRERTVIPNTLQSTATTNQGFRWQWAGAEDCGLLAFVVPNVPGMCRGRGYYKAAAHRFRGMSPTHQPRRRRATGATVASAVPRELRRCLGPSAKSAGGSSGVRPTWMTTGGSSVRAGVGVGSIGGSPDGCGTRRLGPRAEGCALRHNDFPHRRELRGLQPASREVMTSDLGSCPANAGHSQSDGGEEPAAEAWVRPYGATLEPLPRQRREMPSATDTVRRV